MGVHVHGLAAIAPAGCDGDGGTDALALEFLLAGSRLCHASDSRVGNDALHGRAIAVAQIGRNQFGYGVGQCHRLFFQAFADTTLTAVNGGADSNFGVFHGVLLY